MKITKKKLNKLYPNGCDLSFSDSKNVNLKKDDKGNVIVHSGNKKTSGYTIPKHNPNAKKLIDKFKLQT